MREELGFEPLFPHVRRAAVAAPVAKKKGRVSSTLEQGVDAEFDHIPALDLQELWADYGAPHRMGAAPRAEQRPADDQVSGCYAKMAVKEAKEKLKTAMAAYDDENDDEGQDDEGQDESEEESDESEDESDESER